MNRQIEIDGKIFEILKTEEIKSEIQTLWLKGPRGGAYLMVAVDNNPYYIRLSGNPLNAKKIKITNWRILK